MNMIEIENLHVEVENNCVLNGVNLQVKMGEVHAIMGPNGSGKSTLAKVMAGYPSFQVTKGSVRYNVNGKMQDLLSMEPYQRAKAGVFLGFQYPIEIPGVSNLNFLHASFNAICTSQGASEMDEEEFRTFLQDKLELLEIGDGFLSRSVNSGFSGGEKKKNEILQMATLSPSLALLDETDSGLDIDALKIVAKGVNSLKNKHNTFVLVTHYQRLLNYISPDKVHVLSQGKIVKSGSDKLALELEERGYDWLVN